MTATHNDAANARLIAAAPELLEALRLVVDSVGFGDATAPGQPSDLDGGPVCSIYLCQETIDAIRAAIHAARPGGTGRMRR